MSLPAEEIQRLLQKELDKIKKAPNRPDTPKTVYPAVKQEGPWRWHDKDLTCASKGCRCWTSWTVQGIPYCSVHAVRKLNAMLVEKGVLS